MLADGSAREPKAQVPMAGGRGITLEILRAQGPFNPEVSLMHIPESIINFVDPM
jgi:hypothetical protein